MARKNPGRPNCLNPKKGQTVHHDYAYVGDSEPDEDGYLEVYRCTLCGKSVKVNTGE